MQSADAPWSLTLSVNGSEIRSDEIYLFSFFWIGFLVLRRCCGAGKQSSDKAAFDEVHGLLQFADLRDDFTQRRYEQVLNGWARLDYHTAEALALVVSSLLALGRPDDIGGFVAKTSASLPHLRPDLRLVVAAVAAPACGVRRQHALCALRDLHEQAWDVLDTAAGEQLLLAFAEFNDEARVASIFANLVDHAEPKLLSKVVRSFLVSQNLDAALRYLRQVLAASSTLQHSLHDLVVEVVKVSTEAELHDDSATSDASRKAWSALNALEGVKITEKVALLFLEWAARQTPVDIKMATRVQKMLHAEGPLPRDACDALVRVHASSAGDEAEAFACFDEFVQRAGGAVPIEAALVGMISSCMETHNCALAEHIFTWACKEERCTPPVFSATLKVLAAAKKPERICAIYDALSSKDVISDEALVEQIANAAEATGRVELAKSLSKSTKKQNVQNHLNLMRACAQDGDVEQVLTLLAEVREQGEVNIVTYNCVLDICVSCGDKDAANAVLKEMRESDRLDVATYNIMLKQCLSEGAPPKVAQGVIMEMRQRGLEPNTATYNSLLSCAMTAGDFNRVWQVLEEVQVSGQGVDIYTLSILFKGYRREKKTMDSESIRYALMLIQKYSVKVDESLVGVVLEACLALRDVSCVRNALDAFWGGGWTIPRQASLYTYGLLIKAYGQTQSVAQVWELWTEVTKEKQMDPSEQLYGQMMDVLVANNCLQDALTIFQEMKETHKSSLNSQGFGVAWGMIIRGFAQQKDCVRALQCYEEMKETGTKASLVVLNTLIDACSRVGDMTNASKIFKDMESSHITPDLITYSTLIKGCCMNDDLEKALQFFATMQEKGIRPDAIVFNSLLDGCAKQQSTALCQQIIQDMENAGVAPSNHSASIMIKLYGRCRDLDAAFCVINEMPRKYGFRANNAVYTCLMSACIANGAVDKALGLHSRMVAEGCYPDDRTYSTLLRGALRGGNVDQCCVLVNAALDQTGPRMQARNLLEEDLVRSVLILTQRQNLWATVGRDLSERLRSCGMAVRLPLPSDSCVRSDGFGRQPRQENNLKGKGSFEKGCGKGSGKDDQQRQQHVYHPQRRY